MTSLVSLERVTKQYAEKLVLDDVSFGVQEAERTALLGRNGSGKSTLLRIVTGEETADAGRVVVGNDVIVAYSPQEPVLDPSATVLDVTAGDSPAGEYEAQARGLLHHLGLTDFSRAVGVLSGGQRKRVSLAATLLRAEAAADLGRAVLLVLDEPTNHLDVDVIAWLEGRLRSWRGALLLVTHDRYLLDRVATRVVELHRGRLHSQGGSYADYLAGRALREEQAEAADQRRRNLAKAELAWLRRGPKARTSKSRYRVGQAEALQEAIPDQRQADATIDLPARRIGAKVVELHNAGKAYPDPASADQRWVLRGASYKVAPQDRLGIVGPNGSGKTTLLDLVAGRIEPDEGKVVVGQTVAIGYYGQEPAVLPARTRVLEALQEIVLEANTIEGVRLSASQLLERFLFASQAQSAFVEELSGGERRRLELLRVLASAPNVLVLDEPTNDLDLDTLAVLEDYLDGWPGALIVASHDRYFLDRVCEHLFSVAPPEPGGASNLRHHPGGWNAYRERTAVTSDKRDPGGEPKRSAPRARKRNFNEERERERLARLIEELEQRKLRLQHDVQNAVADYERAQEAGEALASTLRELEAAETRWLELEMIGEEP